MKKKSKLKNWDLIITSNRGWFSLNLLALWAYRDLISLFVKRDIITDYKQTILGPLYFIITPIINTLINMFIFGNIAKLSTDGVPPFLFYMSGTLFWSYFKTCLNAGRTVFQSNVSLFSQVYFPRLAIPISQNISALIRSSIQFMLFCGFFIYFYYQGANINPSFRIILLPLLLFQCSLVGLGTGILISSFTVKYKDLNFIYKFIISIWMYISPVVYPLSVIPEKYRYFASFNPLVGIIETGRELFFGISSFNTTYMINGFITTFIMVLLGLLIFNRVEKNFLDTV